MLLGTQRTAAAFRETTKEKHIAGVMWQGREVRAEEDKQMQSSTQRKSTNRQGRYSRSGFSVTSFLEQVNHLLSPLSQSLCHGEHQLEQSKGRGELKLLPSGK